MWWLKKIGNREIIDLTTIRQAGTKKDPACREIPNSKSKIPNPKSPLTTPPLP
jgi:hypothetical protein